MSKKTLHITNGDSLNDWLLKLQIDGDFAVWREMLCEGKTTYKVGDQHFKNARKAFLKEDYDIDISKYDEIFSSQLELIYNFQKYDELVLWFEYDLFCHINMMACISYLVQLNCKLPIYLVCSGRITGEKELKGLSEITEEQLLDHYQNKIALTRNDLILSDTIWKRYCSDDHTQLQPIIATDSSFIYLSNCLSAHKKRFPEEHSGLNTLESHILKLLKKHQITSERQLCGYVLKYQGYYGYGDMQISKMIKRLRPYFQKDEDYLVISSNGQAILDENAKVYSISDTPTFFGGVSKYAYAYNKDSHQITKV